MASLIDIALNFGLGASLGIAGGMLGIGGGLIAIPVLGILYGMNQHLAQGTALVMIAPNVAIGFWRYHQKHPVDLRSVGVAGLCSIGTAWLAARFAVAIDAQLLHYAFAAFLVALAVYFGWPSRRKTGAPPPEREVPRRLMPVIGVASGAVSGFFTIGGGMVVVPALVSLFKMPQTRAQGMALALVVPGAFVALATYGHSGAVDWQVGLPLALGGVLTVSWGVHLAHTLPQRLLRVAFCTVLLGAAISMLVSGA
ncbi:sulfite exporter TauE/SafE family protein [Massilia sp. HP4]|uniref:sulfite exporter TauE/SafE family protein n=1 Tax=Massilia sp. HP4 TaxID=2562316 RepID=UPI0010C01EC9|nr:sulfite exporter TauE/SafE family protein [Massilia sp. HP4]